MKIIEALKKIPELKRKCGDYRARIHANCARSSLSESEYGTEAQAVFDGWVQAHGDMVNEIATLKLRIQYTNIKTLVPIEIGDAMITKSIASWILWRDELASMYANMWVGMNDRGLKAGPYRVSAQDPTPIHMEVVRYFDPIKRDKMVELFNEQPKIITAKLEIINAVTDLLEIGE